ncbi:serine/threonine protein kinase [Murinocardiopsis flavida]|uniref:Serine/threonine protein kinase n=2 Tax=Murinocardiopsis flavida TaxID=645275 RepID=A0A2P8DMJ5_9ACTN|nr:serine/threonine protein kinase [Murinocardiopsis flavida]
MSPLADGDPARLGPFQVQGRLGAGGMGVVYGATGPDGRWVALKLIRAEYTGDAEFRDRFAREVALMSRVRAACIAPVIAAETDRGQPWYATPYIPGPTLDAQVKAAGPLPLGQVEALAVGLAEAVAAIHAAGIVHRDLKPANVILAPDGPKVLDFGIARAVDESAITRTGGLVGSPGWMSPERFRGATGPEADVFAWGAMVAYAVLGRPPFGTGAAETLMYRILNEEPDLDGLPAGLTGPVVPALDKDPARRPPAARLIPLLTGGTEALGPVDATEVATTLIEQQWTPVPQEDGPPVPAPGPGGRPPPAPGPPTRRPGPHPPAAARRRRTAVPALAAALLVLVLLGGSAAWFAYRGTGGAKDGAQDGGPALQKLVDQGYARVGFSEWAPISFTNTEGRPTGYSIEVARAVFKDLGVPQVKAEVHTFDSLLPGLRADRFDAVSAGMAVTPERCERAAFADPDAKYTTSFVVKKGNPKKVGGGTEFTAPGMRLAVVNGTAEGDAAASEASGARDPLRVNDLDAGMRAVRSEQAAAVAAESVVARWTLRHSPADDLQVVSPPAPLGPDRPAESHMAMAFAGGDTELAAAVNDRLAAMRRDGRMQDIGARFGMSERELPDDGVTAESLCS